MPRKKESGSIANVPRPIFYTLAVIAIVVVLVVTLPYPPFLLTVILIFINTTVYLHNYTNVILFSMNSNKQLKITKKKMTKYLTSCYLIT